MNWQSRSSILLGEKSIAALAQKSVLIIGAGGVGGYALETIARCGVGHITIVDDDVFDETNLNRQLLATSLNLGKSKAEEAAIRVKAINPEADVTAVSERFTAGTADNIFSRHYDYVADCIDSVSDKAELIIQAAKRGVSCISALGAANRLDIDFRVTDIYKTQGDGLARVIRKKLREADIPSHKVVCSNSPGCGGKNLGSVVFPPAACGITLGREIILDLLKSCENNSQKK